MTVFADTFDTNTPPGGGDPAEADDRMRETKGAVQERENVDHQWAMTGTEVSAEDTGEHRKITFNSSIGVPAQVAGKAHLYMNADELYYQDDTNTTIPLTSGGVHVNNVSITGTIASVPTPVFTKYLSGIGDGEVTEDIAHGITDIDKILHVSAAIKSTSGFYEISDYRLNQDADNQFAVSYDGTNVRVSSRGANVQSGKYRIKLDYIE